MSSYSATAPSVLGLESEKQPRKFQVVAVEVGVGAVLVVVVVVIEDFVLEVELVVDVAVMAAPYEYTPIA